MRSKVTNILAFGNNVLYILPISIFLNLKDGKKCDIMLLMKVG